MVFDDTNKETLDELILQREIVQAQFQDFVYLFKTSLNIKIMKN